MIDKIKLSDIDISKMMLIKETYVWYENKDHSRWIFNYKGNHIVKNCNELFFKIWNPSYVRRDNILRAIDAGFYDEKTTPALKALIYHNGLCRGYVMDKCNPDLKLGLDDNFFNIVKEKSRKTKFFNAQFSPCHVMKYKGWFSLIDLEGVFSISDLTEIHKYRTFFDYEDYENFIVSEYNDLMSGFQYIQFSEKMKNKNYFRKFNPYFRLSQSVCKQMINYFKVVNCKNIHMIEL